MQYKFFDRFFSGKICVSSVLVNESIRNGLNKEKLVLIPHFIDNDFFKPKNQKKHNKSDFIIGYSGAINTLNGIYILIESFRIVLKKIKNIKLMLLGTVNVSEKDVFEKSISDIKDNLIFLGMIPSKDVPKYLNRCDILVNPREKSILSDSGFPTKLGEYLSTGKVVITTRTGDLDKYFHDKKDLLYFNPGDINQLAKLIIYIYKNNEVALKIGQNGSKSAENHLNYIQSSKKLIDFIKSI